MTKYYNKDIPDKVHVIYGNRQSGKTYYEFNKLKEEYITLEKDYGTCELENSKLRSEIIELKEENKTLKELNVCVGCDNNPDYKSRIDKAIEILESKKHCERLFGGVEGKTFTEQAIEILKGE